MNEVVTVGPSREPILHFEVFLRQFEPRECPLKHTFAPGLYIREIFLPADTFIVGKIHKHSHGNIVVKGRATVVTEFGRREIDASNGPVTFVSEAGAKRALYVHEDTIWVTLHSVDSTDLAEIERQIIAPDYGGLDSFLARIGEQLTSAERARVLCLSSESLPTQVNAGE